MQFVDLTLPTPEENLALDEALLLAAEADGKLEFLRVWESPSYFVVLGKNCQVTEDVRIVNCEADNVPVLRRVSGGGTVLLGPGCLNFSLVHCFKSAGYSSSIADSYDFVLNTVRAALVPLGAQVSICGTDLMLENRKIGGSSQRRQRTHFLHHGTILYDFEIPLISRYLKEPKRQPAHRDGREHAAFLTNLNMEPNQVREQLRTTWNAGETWYKNVLILISDLVQNRYSQLSWNHGR